MANVRAKVFEYTTSVDRDLRVSSEGEQPVEFGESWTPEHILLAALLRCAIASLTYYATPAGIAVSVQGVLFYRTHFPADAVPTAAGN